MTIITVSGVNVSFGTDVILDNISFGINECDRVGIVGVNGAGKSLLLKTICGIHSALAGEIHIPKDKKIGYLEQNAGINSDKCIFDEMSGAFAHLLEMESRIEMLEKELSDCPEQQRMQKVSEYSFLTEKFRSLGGYEYKGRIKSTLMHLGFGEDKLYEPVELLSGGQKTRLALAKLLLSEPDILILDEPTNHLDADTVEWLEEYLKGYRKTLLVVSHDRYFLDNVTNKTLEIENKGAKLYPCSYSEYTERKKKDRETQEKHYKNQQREIERIEAFIENQRRWNRERNIIAAESRMKALDRMDKIEKPKEAPQSISFGFTAGKNKLVSDNFLVVKNLSKAYFPKELFSNLSFTVKGLDRLFVFGANGTGKSTLLKILSGRVQADSGTFEYVKGVKIGYYDQEHQGLSPENTVIEELWNCYPDKTQTEIRNALARFQFRADDVFKQVSVLSGGEKARLTFAKLVLDELSLLILDEPTNHLDAASREVLEDALEDYDGTLIAVSHDRYFIKKLATRILSISESGCNDFKGTYDEFCEKIKLNASGSAFQPGESSHGAEDYLKSKKEKADRRRKEKRLAEVEREMSGLEERIKTLEREEAEFCNDYVRLTEISEEKSHVDEKINNLYEEWAILSEELS